MISKITKLTAVAVASFLSVEMATAQVSEYTFKQTQGTYTDLANPIEIAKAQNNGSKSLDTNVLKLDLPFAFKFNKESYDHLYMCPKGFVFFGDERLDCGIPNPIGDGLSKKRGYEGTDYKGVISAFGTDLLSNYDARKVKASTMSYEVTGEAPNRAITLQWKQFRFYGFSFVNRSEDEDFNFQMTLFENGKIQFVYDIRNIKDRDKHYEVQVGLRGASNQDFNNRVAGSSPYNTWSTSLQGTSNADAILTNGIHKLPTPPAGLTFTYTPPTETLAINDVKAEDNAVKISPNPVSDTLNILAKEGIISYEVIDATGKRVAYGTNTTANVSNLPKGVYIVKVKGKDNKITTQKIIKK